jgi:hypothetical protein
MTKPREWDAEEPVICEQPPTWVYWNPNGQIVFRQRQTGFYHDEEPFLFLSIENVPALIRALQQKLAEDDVPEPRVEATTARHPLTDAERQRRRRKRQRDESHEPSPPLAKPRHFLRHRDRLC